MAGHSWVRQEDADASGNGWQAYEVWRNVRVEATIEVNMIAGMGHGTPIGDGLGALGPFMLNAGITSTREIARFWNIDATQTNGSMRSNLKTAAGEKAVLPLAVAGP